MRVIYDTEVSVKCTDNGRSLTADVIEFNPGVYMSVSLSKVKVNLQYSSKFDEYVGSMGGLEFIAKSPKRLDF